MLFPIYARGTYDRSGPDGVVVRVCENAVLVQDAQRTGRVIPQRDEEVELYMRTLSARLHVELNAMPLSCDLCEQTFFWVSERRMRRSDNDVRGSLSVTWERVALRVCVTSSYSGS